MVDQSSAKQSIGMPQEFVTALDKAFPPEPSESAPVEDNVEETEVAQAEAPAPQIEDSVDQALDQVEQGAVPVDLGFDDVKGVVVEVGDEQVTVEGLKYGYMKNKDYTQKTQALAQERGEVNQMKTEYARTLDFFNEQAGDTLRPYENIDWRKLQHDDPATYQDRLREFQTAQQASQRVNQNRNDFIQRAHNDREAIMEQQAKTSQDMLAKLIPDWSTSKYSQLRQYAAESEFNISADEFNQVSDWRFIAMLNKSMNYDDAQKLTTQKVTKPLKQTLTSKTTPSVESGSRKGRQDTALKRLKGSGSVNDLADFYAAQIKDMDF